MNKEYLNKDNKNFLKFYQLANNMLDGGADVTTSWNSKTGKYEISKLFLRQLGLELELQFDDMPLTRVFIKDTLSDTRWYALFPDQIDEILHIIRTYTDLDYLLEGIDEPN